MVRCLIIEDEPVARDILRQYISGTPNLELIQEFEDAISALAFINERRIDLLFLDINMPKLSSIGFLKSLINPPKVILTTAYSEYALESYELDVVDYLLKPFSFERFLKAVNKIELSPTVQPGSTKIIIKADGKVYHIEVSDILFVESMGDYLTLYTVFPKTHFLPYTKSLYKRASVR